VPIPAFPAMHPQQGQPDLGTTVIMLYNQMSAVVRELMSLRERVAKLEKSAPPPPMFDIP